MTEPDRAILANAIEQQQRGILGPLSDKELSDLVTTTRSDDDERHATNDDNESIPSKLEREMAGIILRPAVSSLGSISPSSRAGLAIPTEVPWRC